MLLVVVQLSDLHLRNGANTIVDRLGRLTSAVTSIEPGAQAYLIACTGDVAFSGTDGEYQIAHQLFDALRDGIVAERGDVRIDEVFIPGNHDCKLIPTSRARELLIKDALQEPNLLNTSDESVASSCLAVQDAFFRFLESRCPGLVGPAPHQKLFYSKELGYGKITARIDCYNTAWMSTINEMQGQLLAPTWLAFGQGTDPRIVLSLFHHPYNWLEAVNSRAFRARVETVSHVIMTGHEHVGEHYTKLSQSGTANDYLEGAVLQESGTDGSGFTAIAIDTDRATKSVRSYGWNEGYYQLRNEGHWTPLEPAGHRDKDHFAVSDGFAAYLRDPGAAFTHPQKTALALDDIFVFPDFKDESYSKEQADKRLSSMVRGERVIEHIQEFRRVVIMGGEKSGKTTLAKVIYATLHASGTVPVLVSGEALRHPGEDPLSREIDRRIAEQYAPDMVGRYRQVDSESKALLIDDLHQSRLNRKGLNILITWARARFGTIVLFVDDLFQVEELVHQGEGQSATLSFRHWEIVAFGHQLRSRLIEKWITLGQEYTDGDREIARRISEAGKLAESIIGPNLIPSYPLFILTILQTSEATTNHNTALGAYGYYYEALITAALSAYSRKVTMDTLYTYISRLAYFLFTSRSRVLTDEQLSAATDEYARLYKITTKQQELVSILEDARILTRQSEDAHSFKYKYIYYYFVAKYIAENLYRHDHEPHLREQVGIMAAKLYVEEYANIVIFLIYLTKDEGIIRHILDDAKGIYANHHPCDMDTDVRFLAHGRPKAPAIHLSDEDPKSNREAYLRRLDEADQSAPGEIERDDQSLNEVGELDETLRINVAFKTLELMGQIIRNFPGALRGEIKLELAKESYALGLRTLQALLSIVRESDSIIRESLIDYFREKDKTASMDELADKADEFLYFILVMVCLSFVKRISQAVGSQHLEQVYREIADKSFPVAIDLISMSIKLDCFRAFPDAELKQLRVKLIDYHLASYLLRLMVFDHLRFYPVAVNVRRSICAQFDIRTNDPSIIGIAQRKR